MCFTSRFVCVCVLAYLMHSCVVGVALPPLCCSWPLWPPALVLVFCVFGWASVFPPLFSSPSPHLHSLLGSDGWTLTFREERTSCPRNTPASHHTHTMSNVCTRSFCDFKWLSHLFARHRIQQEDQNKGKKYTHMRHIQGLSEEQTSKPKKHKQGQQASKPTHRLSQTLSVFEAMI